MQAQNKKKQSRNESHREHQVTTTTPSEWLPMLLIGVCWNLEKVHSFVAPLVGATHLAAPTEEHVPREGLHYYVIFCEFMV
jgi:hypothetical protein